MTSGEFGAGNFRWSADGTRIFFVSDRRPASYYYPRDSNLYAVSKDGGEPTEIASIDGNIGAYAFSPDGKRVAFVGVPVGSPERSFTQPDLWVMDVPGGSPRNLTTAYDFDINGGLGGDQRAPRGQLPSGPVWSRDGRSIVIAVGLRPEQLVSMASELRYQALFAQAGGLAVGNDVIMSGVKVGAVSDVTLHDGRAFVRFSLDDDIASRWGPRVVDLVRRIADAVKGVPEANAA